MRYDHDTLYRLSLLLRQLKVANAKEERYRVILEDNLWNDKKDRDRAQRIVTEQAELIENDVKEIKELIKILGL